MYYVVRGITTNTNYIRFYWNGNLEVGKQISTEDVYQSTEQATPGRQYFLCRAENCVIKLSKELIVAEIIPCPPADFDLILDKNFAINSNATTATLVGKFVGSPVNKNIKYQINNNAFGIHNDLFSLTGGDPLNNIQNINLIVNGDVSDIGTEAKLSIRASNHNGVGLVEKNFTINIIKSELQRYAECTRISVSGFECDFMNGNYGLVYHPTLSSSHEMGYAYYNKKLLFRTTRKFTNGFVLLDGTLNLVRSMFILKLNGKIPENDGSYLFIQTMNHRIQNLMNRILVESCVHTLHHIQLLVQLI